MSTIAYYPSALLQYILFQHNLTSILSQHQEISKLKESISILHKKHRRCDKQIEKCFKCNYCQKNYASDVALKLHKKLKHKILQEKSQTSHTALEIDISDDFGEVISLGLGQ